MPAVIERIGVLGGSFDPIHNRHIEIAQNAMNEYSLDKIIFIPTVNPPHKNQINASVSERIQMIKIAISSYKNFFVSDIELLRDGTIYSVDTMKILKKNNPNATYFYIIGEDSLNYLDTWHKAKELFKLCEFIVCKRFSDAIDRRDDIIKLGAKLNFLSTKPIDISSTKIRDSLKYRGFSDDIPITVFEYINDMGLYGIIPYNVKYREYIIKLQTLISDKRFAHSLSVAYTGRMLSQIYKLDEDVSTIAGLLHDCAKGMSIPTMQKIANDNNMYLDSDIYNSSLIHAPVGAQIAKTIFEIKDNRVLSAISYHTTGMTGMNAMDMIIFLADKIEATRPSYAGIEEIRLYAKSDLKMAMRLSIKSTSDFLKILGKTPHINTVRLLEWLKK